VFLPFKDMREWIDKLEDEGQLARVKAEVDWKHELGAVMRRGWDIYGDSCPAMLFENIKDYKPPKPNKVFVGSLQTYSRIALMMDMPPVGKYPSELVREYRKRKRNLIKPKTVSGGPCKENILKGDDIDVWKFPVPWWNLRDGNRYVGTFHAVITKDPETGLINVGCYRMMGRTEKLMNISAIPGWQHIGYQYQKYMERDESMEVAVSVGQDPVVTFVASASIPGVCEWDLAGGIRGKPVELVKGETTELQVPATAEVVLEGTVDPKERGVEGPFGEYPGYYGSIPVPKPIFRCRCITHREDPIWQGTVEGYPVNEDHALSSVLHSADAWDLLDMAAVPSVREVACPLSACGYGDIVVSIRPSVEGHEDWVAAVVWGSSAALWCFKRVIVVDEDIDPWNMDQVNWSIFTRVKASDDIKIWKDMKGNPLDPRVEPEKKGFWDRYLVKATRPYHWAPRTIWGTEGIDKGIPLKFPPIVRPAPEMMEHVNKKWDEYGIKPVKTYVGRPTGMFANFWSPDTIEKIKKLKIMP